MSNIFAPLLTSVCAQTTMDLHRRVLAGGLCVGTEEPDAWFPREPPEFTGGSAEALAEKRAAYEAIALDLCGPCPVRAECLELALREEIVLPRTWVHGIRGGTAPWQRLNLIRQRQRAAQRKAAGAGRAVSA
ncbi:WhiB family transcriptional regulator [Sphaerisporangium sp. NPDC005288]|uniref:WhiB family transcriptional regulator n=1 Tax=Sphaerisporangium sp. NPDC005288 TaxID=3155114 RepID=UPI0033BDA670